MRKIITIEERIAVRAYYAWLNGSTSGAQADWCEAELYETGLAIIRSARATRTAHTRKVNRAFAAIPVVKTEKLVRYDA